MESAVVDVEYAIVATERESDSRAGAVEILVVTCATDDIPIELDGLFAEIDPGLQLHEELTGSVIADEMLDPLEVEPIRGEPRHLARGVINHALGAHQTVVNGLA